MIWEFSFLCFLFLFPPTHQISNWCGFWKEPKTQLIFEIVYRKLDIGCLFILSESRGCFLWYSEIVLLKKKISSLRNQTHKKRNTNKYSYNRRPQGSYFKHSVLLLNHIFPFIFRNMLLIPVVYSTVGCDILPLRYCFCIAGTMGRSWVTEGVRCGSCV